MIVVSDTSPLTALLTVEQAELLLQLFGEVVIPEAVYTELLRCHSNLPSWLRVQALREPTQALTYASSVDRGEAEAIALAHELKADLLLMDERKGRRLAREHGVPVMGLLGVILLAKRRGFIDSARALLTRLEKEAGVYLGEQLKTDALKTIGE
jgi:predicted nucleic acid-binding protein